MPLRNIPKILAWVVVIGTVVAVYVAFGAVIAALF